MANMADMAANVEATESAIGKPGRVGGRSGKPVKEGIPEKASAIVP
jgi:hypothetical protein